MEVYCETCPIRYLCRVYVKADEANRNSYYPQDVVTCCASVCPLAKVAQGDHNDS